MTNHPLPVPVAGRGLTNIMPESERAVEDVLRVAWHGAIVQEPDRELVRDVVAALVHTGWLDFEVQL